MPALKVSEEERASREAIAKIESYMALEKIKKPELAKRAYINYTTLAYKFRNPDAFMRAELRRICKVLKVPREERGILI